MELLELAISANPELSVRRSPSHKRNFSQNAYGHDDYDDDDGDDDDDDDAGFKQRLEIALNSDWRSL